MAHDLEQYLEDALKSAIVIDSMNDGSDPPYDARRSGS